MAKDFRAEELSTKEKLKRVLAEWKESLPAELVRREFDESYLKSGQILTITGPRRAGKTYLCYQIIKNLMQTIPDSNILYINFEDERLAPFRGDELTVLLEAFAELSEPEKGHKLYVFIDEIQNVPNWGKWCRRVHETKMGIKLVITGSSSKLLSKELSTELRGRALTKVVFPYSFAEFLEGKGIKPERKSVYHSEAKAKIRRAFKEYVEYGGFPRVLSEPPELKKQTLQGYYSTMFYKDIVERFNVRDTALLETFLKVFVDNFASHISVTRLESKLKSMGLSPGKGTLAAYLSYARDIFLLFQVKMFSFKLTEQLRNPSKVYAVDTGLVNSVRFSFSEDYGRHLENLVFLELMRRGHEVYYFKGSNECDFLVKDGNKVVQAIQVTKALNSSNREREINGLAEAMEAHGLKEGLILTDDDYGEIRAGGAKITVRPAWLWMLERQAPV